MESQGGIAAPCLLYKKRTKQMCREDIAGLNQSLRELVWLNNSIVAIYERIH